ncbi:MAG: molybdate ABC transporter substrate-binding protein [Chloroflexi bacterium]|nr:molybdate ABC transporter substrate-binding protein [Chloroflexota bacterium]
MPLPVPSRTSCRPLFFLLIPLLALLLVACAPVPDSLTVAAAADLTPAFTEIGQQFQQQTGIPVTFSFGSSGQAAQQIAEGAPVDLFAAANIAYIKELEQAGLILPDSITLYARGRITLWTPADSPLNITDIGDLARPEVRRIAIANPEHAPYGVAAREALQSAGLWESLQPKLVFGNNIAQTLQLAESGSVDVAIMALSLSLDSEGRWTLIPQELHTPLDQAMAIIASASHQAAARRFSDFVNGPAGRAIMRRSGFVLPNEE